MKNKNALWILDSVEGPALPEEDEVFFGRVYAVKIGKLIKIGYTSNVRQRIASLKTLSLSFSDLEMEGSTVAYTPPHTNYTENEKILKHHFSANCIRGELFDITFETLTTKSPALFLEDMSAQKEQKGQAAFATLKSILLEAYPVYGKSDRERKKIDIDQEDYGERVNGIIKKLRAFALQKEEVLAYLNKHSDILEDVMAFQQQQINNHNKKHDTIMQTMD